MGHRGNDGVGAASSVAGRGVVRGPRRSLRAGHACRRRARQGDVSISLIQTGAAIFDPNKLQGPLPNHHLQTASKLLQPMINPL